MRGYLDWIVVGRLGCEKHHSTGGGCIKRRERAVHQETCLLLPDCVYNVTSHIKLLWLWLSSHRERLDPHTVSQNKPVFPQLLGVLLQQQDLQADVVTEDDLELLILLPPLLQVPGLEIGVYHSLFMWLWGLNPTVVDLTNLVWGVVQHRALAQWMPGPGFYSSATN